MNSTLKIVLLASAASLYIETASYGALSESSPTDPGEAAEPEGLYDVLDGFGKSGCRVDAIEWRDNFEIHVYAPGCVHRISFKIDDKNPQRKVMVIAYRFNTNRKREVIRRAVLGIPLRKGFRVFQDVRAPKQGYDKYILSNRPIRSPQIVPAKNLGPPPKYLYPRKHPKRKPDPEPPKSKNVAKKATKKNDSNVSPSKVPIGFQESKEQTPPPQIDDDGTIKPFNF